MTGQLMVIAGLSLAALVFAGFLRRRAGAQNRRLSTALDNMSQGLCIFDTQSWILVVNRRYIEMYGPSPQVVRPGISLKQLIQYHKNTGLFAGDVDAYCRRIRDSMHAEAGASKGFCIPAGNGRIVLAKNEPLANGARVSTHEDVTAQRCAKEERATIREQEQRRAAIVTSIASFRPQVETLLSSVSDGAAAMRSTAGALFSSSDQTTQRATSAAQAFTEASTNVETAAIAADGLSHSIAEISR
jgi:methyl-accepting chemotaxis protein